MTEQDAPQEAYVRPLYRFGIIPSFDERLVELASLAESEEWDYKHTSTDRTMPILYNYVHFTFQRLEEQGKIVVSPDTEHVCWNTGLVTTNQESVYALYDQNLKRNEERQPPWHFRRFFVGGVSSN